MIEVLITGGAGNIGSELAKGFLRNGGYRVAIIDNLLTGKKENLPSEKTQNFRFIKGDINKYNDIAEVMLSTQFTYVFHYAAVVGVERTLNNPLLVLEDIEGLKNILSLCKSTNVKRIFYSSSSEVYGEPVEIPQHEETTPLNSKLPYAIVKNLGEAFIKSYNREFGLNFTIFRFFNTYGPYQSNDFVIPRFISAAKKGENISVYGDGSQTRTFCFIDDNIETVIKIVQKNLMINETINIGNDNEISILSLANLILELTNSSGEIIHLPALKEGDMSRRCPDITKMKSILGRELTTLKNGVRKFL